jgi:hypothetical protein
MKLVFRCESKSNLSDLLEEYLYGLAEVCHALFGPSGEMVMYRSIRNFFLSYLENRMNIIYSERNPWHRYCQII